MTDYSELAKRLREHAENMYVDFLNEAADALEAQAKEIAEKDTRIAELEAVLRPFADAKPTHGEYGKIWIGVLDEHIRAARAALKGDRG